MFDGLLSKMSLLRPMHKVQDTHLLVTRKWGRNKIYLLSRQQTTPNKSAREEGTHTTRSELLRGPESE